MRKLLPIIAFVGAAIFIFLALAPAKKATVLAAVADLPAGHTLVESDLRAVELPADSLPPDAVSDPTLAVGQTLAVPRSAGDVIRAAHFGQPIALQSDERGLSVKVTDSTGFAGLLQPGQRVGVIAVIVDREANAPYAKVALTGLRVLYIPPDFRAAEPAVQQDSGFTFSQDRQTDGVVGLAVPTAPQIVIYQTTDDKGNPISQSRTVYPLELLAALNESNDAHLTLFLEPDQAAPFVTGGLYLPDLSLITPTQVPFAPGSLAP
ncbi:MAG: Flp pilus assembly protein CpaB [Chloroflexi bacterium]|nr:Flp pilus assembly protein CpaB [Chloroflexota bacterium]